MPAPKITKASINNAIAALKDQGFTPSRMNLNPDGSFSIDIHTESAPSLETTNGPKKWGETKRA